MASLQNVALLPLLLALTAVCVQGFRIRRRSVGMVGYEDSYGLSNALQAVQRRRTKKEMEEAFEPKYLDQDVGYYYPQLSDEMEARGPSYRPTFHGTGSYESDEDFDIPKLYNLQKGAYPVSYGASDSFEFPYPRVGFGDRRSLSPQKRTLVSSYKPRRVPPTLTELEDIFSSANVPMKRSGISPVRRSDHNKGIKQASNNRHIAGDEQNDTGSKQQKEKKSLANFDVEQMRKLIEKAEELQREAEADENVSSESAEEQPTGPNESEIKGPVSVSESELDKIFSITDDKGNTKTVQIKQTDVNGEKHTAVKESESVPVTSDEEKTVEEDEGINAYKSKNKRMAKRDQSETVSDIAELVAKIDMLKGEVQRLRVKQIVEEKENDLLAEALKAATLDQINHSDEFLEQEFDAIDKATEAEELLQTLPDDTVETKYDEAEQLLGEYLSSDDSEDLMEEVKRDEEDDEDELEEEGVDNDGWQEAAIEEQVSPGSELGSRLQDAEDLDEEDLVIEPDMDPELAEEIEEEEMEDEDDTDGLNDKQQILSQLLQGMSPEELADLVNQYSESNSDTCPIITEISSNCVFADKLQMPIDDDARQLCNRHELCYSCGATLGLPMNGCDTGYTHDAIESCGDDVECIQDAEIFLKMMKSYHTYQPFRHAQCDRPCIEDYIIGNDMKKR